MHNVTFFIETFLIFFLLLISVFICPFLFICYACKYIRTFNNFVLHFCLHFLPYPRYKIHFRRLMSLGKLCLAKTSRVYKTQIHRPFLRSRDCYLLTLLGNDTLLCVQSSIPECSSYNVQTYFFSTVTSCNNASPVNAI